MLGHKILRTDLIRKEVLKNEDIFDEKVASNMDKRKMVYDEMFRQADVQAGAGGGVILDATFVLQSLRQRAAKVAADHGKTLVIQQTSCPRDTLHRADPPPHEGELRIERPDRAGLRQQRGEVRGGGPRRSEVAPPGPEDHPPDHRHVLR